MKKRLVSKGLLVFTVMWFCFTAPIFPVRAEQPLRYATSAQVYEAFGEKAIRVFEMNTQTRVALHVTSSSFAVNRLMNELADLACTTEGVYYRHKDYGYVEIPFCKDPIAVIIHPRNKIRNLTEAQLRGIFTGRITNWRDLGGPDHGIVLVVPGKNTAAYKNFDRQMIRRGEIIYDFMTYKSTMAIKAVKKFPYSISFIAQGAASRHSGIITLNIDGRSPKDAEYPYCQMFSFVTKGDPGGPAKAFIDFTFSEKGRAIILEGGMTPLPR